MINYFQQVSIWELISFNSGEVYHILLGLQEVIVDEASILQNIELNVSFN